MPAGEEQGPVIRPALPLLLFPLGGLWLGLFCAERLAWAGLRPHPVPIVILAVAACLSCLFILTRIKTRTKTPTKTPIKTRPPLSLLAAFLLALGIGLAFWTSSYQQAQRVTTALEQDPRTFRTFHTLSLLEDPQQGALSQTSIARLEVAGIGTLKVRVFWENGQEPLPLGTRFTAQISFKPLTQTQEFLYQRGILGSVTLRRIEDANFPPTPLGAIYAFRDANRRLLLSTDGEGSALLSGVLLGDTTRLNTSEAGRVYKVTGLSHLVAVSGSHLVVIALILSWLLKRAGLRRPLEIALVTLLLLSYVFLTGLQPSATRACIMTFIASIAPLVGRRGHVPSALATAAAAMLLLHPPTAFSVGFWLSVYAVFGLTLLCPLITRYLKSALTACANVLLKLLPTALSHPQNKRKSILKRRMGIRTLRNSVFDPLALTITAQAATLPITAPLFATISLVSPLANILVTPFITLIVGAGIATLCLAPVLAQLASFGSVIAHIPLLSLIPLDQIAHIAPFVISALCVVADISIALATWCASLPHACLAVSLDLVASNLCALILAALLYRFWPQPNTRRLRILFVSLLLGAALLLGLGLLPVAPQVVMLDVGQGDAILVREGRANILIDTGPSDTALLRALARQGVGSLDAVILTHLDEDHCGALDALGGTIAVKHVFFAAGLLEAKPNDDALRTASRLLAGASAEELAQGDVLRLGECIELTVLLPAQRVSNGRNDESICMSLDYDSDGDGAAEARMLLTGDAESPQLASLFDSASGVSRAEGAQAGSGATNRAGEEENMRFDILKVGHHGSAGAVTTPLLERMSCRIALISAGRNNRYGHPSAETLSLLEEAGVTLYRTDLNGCITLRFEGARVSANCDTMSVENP